MYNSLTRVQNTFGFFTTVAFVFGLFIALSDFLAPRVPSGTIKTDNVQVFSGRPHHYSTKKEEYASIRFSLDADLSSLFTWNTKQVFVYITADWTDQRTNTTNTAVIWDSIITNPSADHLTNLGPISKKKLIRSGEGKSIDPSRGILKLRNQRPKYQITHPSRKLASTPDVHLTLHYNIQPWVGMLTWEQRSVEFGLWKKMKGGISKAFKLPAVNIK